MLIKSKKFILFSKKNVLINRFLVLFIYILLINTIYSSYSFLSREDTSPEKVAPKILNLINENFLGTNGENNIYFTNIGDYLLEMKFLYLNFIPGEISTDKYFVGLFHINILTKYYEKRQISKEEQEMIDKMGLAWSYDAKEVFIKNLNTMAVVSNDSDSTLRYRFDYDNVIYGGIISFRDYKNLSEDDKLNLLNEFLETLRY